ncbi:hypothetical protein GDO81_010148 [Engystomops pustulosus]|uniref:Uncharacterized protein n=1 Tax=Engystomops pustulosus TaxID=76066 RepID=A0AAV7BXK8_ENGPU|nr:hypothetical protein GDO81_010148 [Engystomops pustulosus]
MYFRQIHFCGSSSCMSSTLSVSRYLIKDSLISLHYELNFDLPCKGSLATRTLYVDMRYAWALAIQIMVNISSKICVHHARLDDTNFSETEYSTILKSILPLISLRKKTVLSTRGLLCKRE